MKFRLRRWLLERPAIWLVRKAYPGTIIINADFNHEIKISKQHSYVGNCRFDFSRPIDRNVAIQFSSN